MPCFTPKHLGEHRRSLPQPCPFLPSWARFPEVVLVVIRYFEGAQIRKKKPGETLPAPSLKEGIVVGTLNKAMKAKRMLVASVETIDETDQEITLKGPDGSLETLMVSDPEFLGSTKVGDQVVITHVQALALSLDKES